MSAKGRVSDPSHAASVEIRLTCRGQYHSPENPSVIDQWHQTKDTKRLKQDMA